jgi:hypothetical protein
MSLTATDDAARLKEFDERGFVVIPDALTAEQVARLNAVVDRYQAEHPDEWIIFSESLQQTVDVLPHLADFDFTIENPRILGLLRGLLGEEISFEEFSIMIRDPTGRSSDMKGWHRDIIRDYNRRQEIHAISAVYYLTDVGQNDHCFSIIPETHNRRLDMRPEDVTAGSEVDVVAAAGSAVLFHARSLHSGKLKAHSRQRRTLHLYFSTCGRPRTSEWSRIPSRLYEKVDARLPTRLYGKWNCLDVIEGTGKKPRDVDPTLSAAELLRIVQARANRPQ